ncbi:MAG: helix-turn-helix domain-containing protein [Sphingobium sp.]|nr:helix-turn-helix domain-containing protein [Sphingobium sp.]MCI1755795.1 helix-turn-helix domain-containing protein [Sphingobium sp.]MCI2053100.1 helix-turn-helix domain-containing protein [Sphingobium sp.]
MAQNLIAGGQKTGGKRLTPFGEKCREIRKAKGMLLIDMAHVAGVSPGFLSLVETGRKPIPDRLVSTLVANLDLTPRQEKELTNSAALSAKEYRIQMNENSSPLDRRLAQALETGFAKMTPLKKESLLKLLEEE